MGSLQQHNNGSFFHAKIENCPRPGNQSLRMQHNTNNSTYTNESIFLNSEKSEHRFQVFPNPNTGTFTLQCEPSAVKYSIRNILGQIVTENTLNNQTETEITLQNQPKGIYMVEVNYQNGEVKREKMVVE
jgi:thiamine pyrophosphokinase